MEPREPLAAGDESAARWYSVYRNAPVYISIIDRDHRVLFHNRVFPGMQPSEVVGHDVYEFIDPAYHEVARARFRAAFAERTAGTYTTRAIGPGGSTADYVVEVAPLQGEGPVTEVMLISIDVTERQRMARSLAESQRLARFGSWEWTLPEDEHLWSDMMNSVVGMEH